MILIHRKTGKVFYIEDVNRDFHTNFGVIRKEDLNKSNEKIIKSHLGEEFLILDDNFNDLIKYLKRGPQSTHQKDIGLLISLVGIEKGWKIVEGGTGSGILTSYLANLVKPDGRVYSYEKRKDFYEIAKKNLEKIGLIEFVDLKLKDITEGIEEKNVDLIVLDIAEPEKVLESAYNALKFGGYLVIFLPNITSVLRVLEKNNLFYFEGMYENIVRKWKYEKNKVLRPINFQLVHTEFLLLFRKI
ncbi:MAG: tRNA (adenine-N1)-methyltransferase [Nanopusillaceae archaeon]